MGILLFNPKYLIVWETFDKNGLKIVLFNEEFWDVFIKDLIMIRLGLVGYHLAKLALIGSGSKYRCSKWFFIVFVVLLLYILLNVIFWFFSLNFYICLEDTFVANDELVNKLYEACCRWSLVIIDGKAILKYLLNNEVSIIPLVIFARILRISVDFQGPDVRLDLMRILTVEWIALRGEIVQAASERPDVNLGGKLVLLAAF